MNKICLYLKAHVARDTQSSVELAKYNPTLSNILFSEKLLTIKLSDVQFKLQKNPENIRYQYNENKYLFLFKKLEEIKQVNLIKNNIKESNLIEYIKKKQISNDLSLRNTPAVNQNSSNMVSTKAQVGIADSSHASLNNTVAEFYKCFGKILEYTQLLEGSEGKDSLFYILDKIDDKYDQTKISLMKHIVNNMSIEKLSELSDITLNSMLNNFTSKDYYLQDNDIQKFIKELFTAKLKRGFSADLKPEYLSACLTVLSKVYNSEELSNFMREENSQFIKLMVLSVHHNDKDIQNKARKLYDDKYLNLSEFRSIVLEQHIGKFPGMTDWSNKYTINMLLINQNKIILTDHNTLVGMIFGNENNNDNFHWSRFSLYIKDKRQRRISIDYHQLFTQDFILFKEHYTSAFEKNKANIILSLFNFDDYADRIALVLRGGAIEWEHKLFEAEDQKKLMSLMKNAVTNLEGDRTKISLNKTHYQEICKFFALESFNNQEKAKYLLSMSILFTKFSSSDVFGTDHHSPFALVAYAYALMRKARELDPQLMTELARKENHDLFKHWTDKLIGVNHSDLRSGMLDMNMADYAKKHFYNIYRQVIPIHWE